jgi:hypothetical protein
MTIGRRLREGIGFGTMAVGMLLVVFATRALLMPATGDTWWHLRAGADIWRTGAAPHLNVYSFTAPGFPWREHEWLWDAISFAAYRVGGMGLLTIVSAALVGAAVTLVYRLMVGPAWMRFVLLLVGLPLTIPLWGVRPHLFTLMAAPLLLALLARERFWPIPLLFVLWANTHGAVAVGGLLLGLATAVALLRWRLRRTPEDRRRALILAVVLPASGLACLATPLGTGIFRFLGDSMIRIQAVGIGEWQRATPKDAYGVIFWIAAIALVGLGLARRRALRAGGHASSWGDWVIIAGALALVPLAFLAVRNVGLFALCALPAASRLLGPHAALRLPWRRDAPAAGARGDRPVANLLLLAGMGAAALVFVAWSYRGGSAPASPLGWHPIDARALAALRACDGPLYNQYDEGGFLIWFAPDKPVFVDNRQDPYPLAHIRAQLDVQWEKAPYRPLFERWGIRCAFLPVGSPTLAALDRDGWVNRWRDGRWAVLSAPADPSP